MAGDWIKMRVNLVTHPKVLLMADVLLRDARYLEWSGLSFGMNGYPPPSKEEVKRERYHALRITRYVCVTALLRFWGYANEHAKGEFIESLCADDVDEIAGMIGFCDALEAIGWCELPESGGVNLPEFAKHNTSAEVRKSGAAERQKAYRERLKQKTEKSDVTRDVTSHAREEKRREEKRNTPKPPKGGDDGFDDFWSTWPKSHRKGGKDKCLEVWRAKGFAAQSAEIIAHVVAMSATKDWSKDEGQFVPAPVVYLRSGAWSGAEIGEPQRNAFEGAV